MVLLKHKWTLPLVLVNAGVSVLILCAVRFTNFQEVLRALAYALAYANFTAILGLVIIGGAVDRWMGSRIPMAATVGVGVLLIVPAGCLLAQATLMWTKLLTPQRFWPEYLQTLRIAMPFSIVFAMGVLVYGSLQTRVQFMEARLLEKEAAEERSRKLAAEARLRWLESRIHPHFLFNTLNSISSLITVNPALAEQLVGRLAALLRASLDTTNQPLIPLRQELALVESYVEIEKVRFSGALRGTVEAPDELQEARVPPMSVQSLVENAVKHGIHAQSGSGEFQVRARADGASLRIEVQDSGPGFDMAAIPAGHGLDNLVGRLHALFGADARLNVFRRTAILWWRWSCHAYEASRLSCR